MKRIMLGLALAALALSCFGADRTSVLRSPSVSAGQNAAYTATAGSTATFPAGADSVMVWCTTDCYVAVGEGATATTNDTPVPAYTPIWLPVPPGSGSAWRVSAIQVSAGGTVYAKPFN